MQCSRLVASGSYLPSNIVTNEQIAQSVDTDNAWIVSRTGIKQRHIAESHETTASMAELACRQALTAAEMNAQDVDMIIVATSTPDRVFPSVACLLQQRLEITNPIIAFDVQAACAGFMCALSVADQFIRTGMVRQALVVGSEIMSRIVDWQDRRTCVLFADGAGAVILSASQEPGIHSTHLYADGHKSDILFTPNDLCAPNLNNGSPYLQMQGREVFKFAVNALSNAVETMLDKHGLQPQDIDWLIPHQANVRIIEGIAKKLALPMHKVITTVDRHANTSAASIPLALDHGIKEGLIKRGQKLLLEGIGGGMTWGSALITY
ncbi:MAG: ketoacyl-ACP synthase III [Gammaproteobacteria bacterium]